MYGLDDVPDLLKNGVESVQSGREHTCVIKVNQKVYCYGKSVVNDKTKFIKPFRDDPSIIMIGIGYFI